MYTVIHIDDSPFFQKMLQKEFEDRNWKYISVDTTEEAFHILEITPVDLIMTKLLFEQEDGENFIRRVNGSRYNHIPIVVVTSNDNIEIRRRMFAMGVVMFIPKNIYYRQLFHFIEKLKIEEELLTDIRKLHIAVLDDDRLELQLIQDILAKKGIGNVDVFSTAEELLASEKQYALYLVDVVLPDISGEQVIMQLRTICGNSMIMAVSCIEHYKVISNLFLAGSDDYIMKPFREEVFIARIKANLRSYLLLQEKERQKAELQKKNYELNRMVRIDGLTGLFNHKYLYERLEQEISQVKRHQTQLSVIMLDIDYFKSVNDTYGHQGGDEVLVKVAKTLQENLRKGDIVGRYGGEEFLAILPHTSILGACIVAEKIRQVVENLQFEHDLKITISCGVAAHEGENALELVGKADGLLYVAKVEGRNKIKYDAI